VSMEAEPCPASDTAETAAYPVSGMDSIPLLGLRGEQHWVSLPPAPSTPQVAWQEEGLELDTALVSLQAEAPLQSRWPWAVNTAVSDKRLILSFTCPGPRTRGWTIPNGNCTHQRWRTPPCS
jgi:hypothetical protein